MGKSEKQQFFDAALICFHKNWKMTCSGQQEQQMHMWVMPRDSDF